MNQDIIFIPVLLHMFLVFFLFIKLGLVKSQAVRLKEVDRKQTALDSKAWPDYVLKVSNNIDNQFEVPVLFYMLSVIFYVTSQVNALVIGLACLFVVSRYLHTYFHITSNYVPKRFRAFLIGTVVLLVLAIYLLVLVVGNLWF